MRSIREVLDDATPSHVVPPSARELRERLRDRTRRRRGVVAAGAVVAVAAIGLSVVTGLGVGQRIESGDQQPDTDATELEGLPTTTTRVSPRPSTEMPEPEPADGTDEEAWRSRWFLVPPADAELDIVHTDPAIWEHAQDTAFERVVVTTDRSDPASAGLAWVYHLDGINMFRIGDPDGTYRQTVVDGRRVRIGEEPGDDRINAFTSSDSGSFVVAGVGLTADQAVELVMAAQLVNGEVDFGDRLPASFWLVAPPASTPVDHVTTLAWGSDGDRFALEMAPTTVEDAVVGRRVHGCRGPSRCAVRLEWLSRPATFRACRASCGSRTATPWSSPKVTRHAGRNPPNHPLRATLIDWLKPRNHSYDSINPISSTGLDEPFMRDSGGNCRGVARIDPYPYRVGRQPAREQCPPGTTPTRRPCPTVPGMHLACRVGSRHTIRRRPPTKQGRSRPRRRVDLAGLPRRDGSSGRRHRRRGRPSPRRDTRFRAANCTARVCADQRPPRGDSATVRMWVHQPRLGTSKGDGRS